MTYRQRALRDWALRISTYLAVMLAAFLLSLLAGALGIWLAYLASLYTLLGVNGTLFAVLLPCLIVLAVAALHHCR